MSDQYRRLEDLSPMKRALVEIRDLRARLEQAERRDREPIAIVGVGLRVPGGAHDVVSFWQMLMEGKDAITPIPHDRWDELAYFDPDPDRAGKMNVRHGAFLDAVGEFDAEFFGISPREAESMDPQHRILLEVCWRALEHAAMAPTRLAGSRAGVFIGINNSDYLRLLLADPDRIDAYAGSGNACSLAAGRLSYLLGVHGPSIAVDTACSSSLVAIHLACQSLRRGESSLAIAGGVNLILSPELNINFSKARMLAPDGHCKTFDARADGYVRGEGCLVVILKLLSSAVADGDRILAVIRGSAVNQDGRSTGITAPNGPAQEAVLRAALEDAGVSANDITYVEAHGTGTSLGDPIEVQALAAVFARDRSPDQPLAIGSLKTNVGHLEAAAGIAGLVKTALALQHGVIPPHLHLREKNPHINWSTLPITIPTTVIPWPPGAPRIAGVSSFGISGTNAHVILEAPPLPSKRQSQADRPVHILALSARNETALRQLSENYLQYLAKSELDIADVCFTANAGRSTFAHRLAVSGENISEMRDALARSISESHFSSPDSRPKIAFLYTGQGQQHVGMARQLYETCPSFRKAIEHCDDLLRPHLDRSLISLFYPQRDSENLLEQTKYAQPAMFALQYALTELWRSWGIRPTVVAGHSLGEYAAALAAGIFSLEDGLKLVAARGRLTGSLPSGGGMLAVFASEEQVRAAMAAISPQLEVAALNGPTNIVVSGRLVDLDRITTQLSAEGIKCHRLNTSHAFHSSLLDPVLDEFEAVARSLPYNAPRIGFISNLTGEMVDSDTPFTAGYWRRHARLPVRFGTALQSMRNQGISIFLEIGPKPVLAAIGMGSQASHATWLASLTPARSDWMQMLESLQTLYMEGVPVDWAGFDRDYARTIVDAPGYPFQRQRYWGVTDKNSRLAGISLLEEIRKTGNLESGRAPIDIDTTSYKEKWACLERLTAACAFSTLRNLGAFADSRAASSETSIIAACGVLPVYRHLIRRWLNLLADKDYLRRGGEGFIKGPAAESVNLEACRRETEMLLADDPYLLAYVKNCVDKLQGVITGKEKPLETLFPAGSPDLAENLYANTKPSRYINSLAAAIVDTAVRSYPLNRPIRVIEIGAGTGGTTSALLPRLPQAITEYLFTDVSEFFFTRAMEKFRQYPWLRFARLDVEEGLEKQGYTPGSFEIVVAANVIHAARDLRAALECVRTLLSPGGILVLVETTHHLPWFDITTGLVEGWQHFADEFRIDSPLLTPERWQELLASHHFENVMLFPEPSSPGEIFGNHIIVAAAPGGSVPATCNVVGERALPRTAVDIPTEIPPLVDVLVSLPEEERKAQLYRIVSDRICKVLRRSTDRPPGKRERLMELGMDSLMAVQFRNALQQDLGLKEPLPATLIFDYPSTANIVEMLTTKIFGQPVKPEISQGATRVRISEEEIENLSDEETEMLLEQRLKSINTIASGRGE